VHVIAVHGQETLFVAPHWHEKHDELFRIIKGRMEVMIGSNTRVYVPEDGEIRIPKRVVHSLRCFIGEETIFEERTEPMVSAYACCAI
jgi:mannose-6-phosphate isomerase-like protein (cupin superfamily)